MTYDVIIVGARCAGASLAMLLARQGARVLLVDRARFPSEIPHGHFIHRHGPRRLRDWGLLDRVASRTPAISRMVNDLGDFPLRVENLVEDDVAWGYGPRRVTFDKILIDAAVESGAELRENFSVTGYLFDGDAVAGIRGRQSGSPEVEERATITIGADGRRSPLARAVGAQGYNEVPALLCYYFRYWSGVESEQFEVYTRTVARRVIFSSKTEDDLYAVFVGAPIEELPAFQRDTESAFLASLDLIPDFAERIRAGRRAERLCGATDLPNFYRKPYGPGLGARGRCRSAQGPVTSRSVFATRSVTSNGWPPRSVMDCRECSRSIRHLQPTSVDATKHRRGTTTTTSRWPGSRRHDRRCSACVRQSEASPGTRQPSSRR